MSENQQWRSRRGRASGWRKNLYESVGHLISIFGLLLLLSFWGGAIYIIAHFVIKYW